MFPFFNHSSCTSAMLVCSFDMRLANTAEALLQYCRFVATSYTLVQSKILSSGFSGLRGRFYHLLTCSCFHTLLDHLITISVNPAQTVRHFQATEWSLLFQGLQSFKLCYSTITWSAVSTSPLFVFTSSKLLARDVESLILCSQPLQYHLWILRPRTKHSHFLHL